MTARPDPPADRHRRPLPLCPLPAKTELYRIHQQARPPVFFGPSSADPRFRFDDPEGGFKICYLGVQREAAFVETLLRKPSGRLISWMDLEARHLARIETTAELRLVELAGPSLRRLGTTAEVTSTRDYTLPQAWSRAVWNHPDAPDGLLYPCRHDDSVHGIALFDRARGKIALLGSTPLASHPRWLGELSERYRFGLTL